MNEPQWVGIIVRPINYSLKGAVLHIDTGPGLEIEKSLAIEMEEYGDQNLPAVTEESNQFTLQGGGIELPGWASNATSVLWVPVRAVSDRIARRTSLG